MLLNTFIRRNLIICGLLLPSIVLLHFYSISLQSSLSQSNHLRDVLLSDVSSFMVLTDEFQVLDNVQSLNNWKFKYDEIRKEITEISGLESHLQKDLLVLEEAYQEVVAKSSGQLSAIESNLKLKNQLTESTQRIFLRTQAFLATVSKINYSRLKIAQYTELGIILLLIISVSLITYYFIRSFKNSFHLLLNAKSLYNEWGTNSFKVVDSQLLEKVEFKELRDFVKIFEDKLKHVSSDLNWKNIMLNSTSDLIWSIDNQLRLVSFNSAYKQTIEGIIGRELHPRDSVMYEEVGSEMLDRWKELYSRALKGETFSIDEYIMIDGKESYGQISFYPKFKEGKVENITCFSRNITQLKLVEEELRKESARLKEAQKIGRIGDWEYDFKKDRVVWSNQLYEIFDWSKDLKNHPMEKVYDFFKANDAALLKESLSKAKDHGIPFDLILQYNNEGLKYLRSIAEPKLNKDGEVVALKGVVQDVTKQIIVEIENERYINRLEALANNLPGVIFHYSLFDDGSDKLIYLSKGSLRLWGISPDEATKNISKIWDQVHPDDLPGLMESLAESARNLTYWNYEWRSQKPNDNQKWYQGIGMPIREDDKVEWNSLILDITERKNLEINLIEREAYLNQIYDNAFDAIFACDKHGKLTFANNKFRQWVGDDYGNLNVGKYSKTFGFYKFDGSAFLRKQELCSMIALNDGFVRNNRFVIKNELNNQARYVEANGSSIITEGGEVKGAVVIIRDITEQHLKDLSINSKILGAIEEERQSLASELHDGLAQNLGIARMHINSFILDNEKRFEKSVGRSIEYLDLAIRQTRDMAHGLMPRSVSDFGLVAAVEELVDLYNRDSSFKTYFFNDGDVRVDREVEIQLYRVIQECLLNIRKHAHAKSCTIRVESNINNIRLSIIDDGKGFDLEEDSNVGIGLVTMRNRLLKLGGTIQIESDNKGTTIIASCPSRR